MTFCAMGLIMSEELLEELIKKHSYIVSITVDMEDELQFHVNFAGKKQCYYRVVRDEEETMYGVVYWSDLMELVNDEKTGEQISAEEFMPLNTSLVRLYILCDIYRQCRELKLSEEIVRFYSSEGNTSSYNEICVINMDEQDKEIEKTLESCMTAILNGHENITELMVALEKDGLRQHFNLLKSTLI